MQNKFILLAVLSVLLIAVSGAVLWHFSCHKTVNPYDFPIDLVYTWVDGSDGSLRAKREYWQKKQGITETYAVSSARWRDREELKYSLRSIEKYMPWVRKIFIVTDNQVPAWLNLRHPKIEIVDHRDIFPADALPVFNSMAIESRLAHIPDLAEHFIYANDDMFANAYMSADFFFTPDGTPIFYDEQYSKAYLNELFVRYKNEMWVKLWQYPTNLLVNKFGVKPFYLIDTHTLGAFRKSDFLKAENVFPQELKHTAYSKFRSEKDVGLTIVYLLASLEHRVVVKGKNDVDKKFKCNPAGIAIVKNLRDLETMKPCQFCLNDTQNNSDVLNRRHEYVMQHLFPRKSSFEK